MTFNMGAGWPLLLLRRAGMGLCLLPFLTR